LTGDDFSNLTKDLLLLVCHAVYVINKGLDWAIFCEGMFFQSKMLQKKKKQQKTTTTTTKTTTTVTAIFSWDCSSLNWYIRVVQL